jgi:hypothetical protein
MYISSTPLTKRSMRHFGTNYYPKSGVFKGCHAHGINTITSLNLHCLLNQILVPGKMTVVISELKEQVAGSIVTPEDTGYADAIHRWAANAEKKAAVVVQVTSPADVAAAVLPRPSSSICNMF